MYHSAISQIDGYWHGLLSSGGIPNRRDVNPTDIEAALDFVFVLGRLGPGLSRFRLSGPMLNALMGMDLRTMPFDSLFEPPVRGAASNAVEDVCKGPKIARLSLVSRSGPGREAINANMFMAPLTDHAGSITRILGCIQYSGRVGPVPRRFDKVVCEFTDLDSNRSQKPMFHLQQAGMAEEGPTFASRRSGTAQLRLVHCSD